MGKIIALIGNTGVGKTSLARALSNNGEFNLGLEQHSNRPFQVLFKSNSQYALANQIDFFLLRAEQEKSLRNNPQIGIIDGGLDQDYHGFTKLFHHRAMLTDSEYELCSRLYNFIRSQLQTPDLIIHLTASQNALRQRLEQRNRINIATKDDLEILENFLSQWSASLPKEQILKVDISSTSPSYQELLPYLRNEIRERMGLDIGSYDTGYIP